MRERHQLDGDAPDDFEIYNPADVLAAEEGSARAALMDKAKNGDLFARMPVIHKLGILADKLPK